MDGEVQFLADFNFPEHFDHLTDSLLLKPLKFYRLCSFWLYIQIRPFVPAFHHGQSRKLCVQSTARSDGAQRGRARYKDNIYFCDSAVMCKYRALLHTYTLRSKPIILYFDNGVLITHIITHFLMAGETTIAPLVQHVYMSNVQAGRTPLHSLEHYLDQVTHIFEVEYAQCFGQAYDEVKRRKLGLFAFDSGANPATTQSTSSAERENEDSKENNDKIDALSADQQLWLDLELLMAASDVDFTILFRELSKVAELLVGPDATHTSGTLIASVLF